MWPHLNKQYIFVNEKLAPAHHRMMLILEVLIFLTSLQYFGLSLAVNEGSRAFLPMIGYLL